MTLKVLKKSAKLQTYDGPNNRMTYFNVIGGVGRNTRLLKVYKIDEFEKLSVGLTFTFENGVKKPDGSIWIVSKSRIKYSKGVEYDGEADRIPLLPEDEPETGSKRTLQDALRSPQKSTVCAKVVKVSPVKFEKEGTLAVRCLGVKDESGCVKLVAFAKAAEETYAEGSTIEVAGVYSHSWQRKQQLNFSVISKSQFVPDSLPDIEVTQADRDYFMRDGDFSIRDNENIKDLTLDGIYQLVSYDACANGACRKKKMVEGICPTCEGDSRVWTYRAKVSIVGAALSSEMVLFQSSLEQLFGVLEERSDNQLIAEMVSQLPVHFTAKVHGTNLYKIEKKPC